jgi:LPXTG-motif cell wall-anchored protein
MRIRIASAVIAAGIIVTAPTAAFAYEADEYEVATGDTTPAVGEPFTVTVTGPDENPEITLTISSPTVPDGAIEIAGTQALTKATVDGTVTFTVTLHEAATYTLVATDADGTVLSTQTITAVEEGAAGGSGADAVGGGAAALPRTGSETTAYVAGAGLLVAGGAGALVYANRRRNARV